MKKGLLPILFLLVFVSACDKGKYQTKPSLKIKEVNGDLVPVNATLIVELEFTDKEGDVSDTLFIIRQRLNQKSAITYAPNPYKVPSFPKETKGVIRVQFDYNLNLVFGILPISIGGNPPKYENDTMNYKFVLKDQAGNVSDTAVLSNIVVLRQ